MESLVTLHTPFRCRSCEGTSARMFIDLGLQPLANALVDASHLDVPDVVYPLRARVCESCLLVQTDEVVCAAEIFSDYPYFSSYSDTWVAHAARFSEDAIERLGLGPTSHVIEVASNDGYLLQNFVKKGIPVLGIEPASNVAEAARAVGVPTDVSFFGEGKAREIASAGGSADLIVANNVLAHVPDLNDFVSGLALALKPRGALSIEFPHLLQLLRGCQFDTIYHEHYSYFSLLAVEHVFARHGLRVFDVEELSTHGGSLRIWAGRADAGEPVRPSVQRVRAAEASAGLNTLAAYDRFESRVVEVRRRLLLLLEDAARRHEKVVAYGAAAKGNTLLNYCGIDGRLVEFVADRSPHKQNRWMPGSRLPIRSPETIRDARPGLVLILPWNLTQEITTALAFIREWGGRFMVAIPEPAVLPVLAS